MVHSAAMLSAVMVVTQVPTPALATDFTAGVFMEKMDAAARVPFIQGIIDGLAYSRYLRDNEHRDGDQKTEAGMNCVYDWYFKKPHALNMIYQAFSKFPDYPPVAIINSLIKQECGA